MLCAKRQSDGRLVIARDEQKSSAPFFCPDCDADVTLRKCSVRIDHFAHKPPVSCRYGWGETEAHRRCKLEIYEALLKETTTVRKAALERSLKTVRPDVSAYINGKPVAIEVQISALNLETIIHRTSEYARKGVYLLWLAQWTPDLDAERYSPRLWERWVHAAYFGRVYYWKEGLSVVPYSLEAHCSHVPDRFWYSDRGEESSAGGFYRTSKRYKTPVPGDALNLITDFVCRDRDAWESKRLQIPKSKLYLDKHPRPKSEGE